MTLLASIPPFDRIWYNSGLAFSSGATVPFRLPWNRKQDIKTKMLYINTLCSNSVPYIHRRLHFDVISFSDILLGESCCCCLFACLFVCLFVCWDNNALAGVATAFSCCWDSQENTWHTQTWIGKWFEQQEYLFFSSCVIVPVWAAFKKTAVGWLTSLLTRTITQDKHTHYF